MDRTRLVLSAALLALVPVAGHATTVWVCGLSDDGIRLVCVADAEASIDTAAPEPPTAVVRGTRFPLDAARSYTVDLWSPPTEPAFVEQLAKATICYRSADCEVHLAPGPWLLESRVALAGSVRRQRPNGRH